MVVNDEQRVWLLVSLLFAAVALLLYWPAQSGGWYFDDKSNLVYNPALRQLASSFSLLSAPRGITLFTFGVERSLWGLVPAASRWVNVALHLGNSLLVVALVRQLTAGRRLPAILIGLLFLCHPVQSAAVSYIVQRMTLLSAGFALATLLLADRYFLARAAAATKTAWLYLGFALPCGILSALAKENTVLLPLAILLLAWYRGKGRFAAGWQGALAASALIPLLPVLQHARNFFASSGAIGNLGGATLYSAKGTGFYPALDDTAFLPFRYLLAQLEVFWVYLGLVCLPLRQSLDYSWPIPEAAPRLLHIATALLLGALLYLAFRGRERFPLTFFGVVWILLFMAVESSLIPLDPIFVHRLYLPLVGGLLILHEQLFKRWPQPGIGIVLILVGGYSFLTWQRNALWGDPIAFWQQESLATPRASRPRLHLAAELFRQGRYQEAAVVHQELAAGSARAWNYRLLGEARFFAGDRVAAEQAFAMAEQIDPSLALSGFFAAQRAISERRFSEAEQLLSRAEARDGSNVFGLYLRGLLAEGEGDRLQAVNAYRQTMRLARDEYSNRPDKAFDEVYAEWAAARRATLLAELSGWLAEERARFASPREGVKDRTRWAEQLLLFDRYDEALAQYRQVVAQAPERWQTHYNLGLAYSESGDEARAIASYREGLRLSPDNPMILLNYAVSLKREGHYRLSAAALERLLAQTPDDGRAWIAYGRVLEALNDRPGALAAYRKAALLPGFQEEALELLEVLEPGASP